MVNGEPEKDGKTGSCGGSRTGNAGTPERVGCKDRVAQRESAKEWVGGAGPGGRRGWGLQVTANPRRLLRSVGVAGGWCRGLGLGAPALGCCRVQSSLLALSF